MLGFRGGMFVRLVFEEIDGGGLVVAKTEGAFWSAWAGLYQPLAECESGNWRGKEPAPGRAP